jgi:2-polyprenyl-3-methyl-5-hydroxy-6-metoxy-1,4-benzoquinol methylase
VQQRQVLARQYDALVRSPILDRESRSDLFSQRPRHLAVLAAIDSLEGPRTTIVDLGPGNGALLRLTAELGFSSFVAVDQEPREPSFLSELDGARRLAANFNDEAFLGEIGSESADVVVSTEVLEHILNYPLGYLREAWRIVRPGGLLVLTTPNPCTLANAVRIVAGRPFQWGDQWFAETPKVVGGQLTSYPFVHFREYPPTVFRELVSALPGARLLDSGFVANAGVPGERAKSIVLGTVHRVGLGGWRPLSHTQYAVVVKDRSPPASSSDS